MTPESNKAAKLKYIEAFNAENLDMIDDLFAPGYVLHASGLPDVEGPGALKEMVSSSLSALSEAAITVEDMVAEGDKVATRWSLTAIHSGDFMGVPATNRRITMTGILIDQFEGGRVVEAWENLDMYGLMQQLGALPS